MAPRSGLVEYIVVFALAAITVRSANFTLEDEMKLLRKLDVEGYAKLHGFTLERVKAITDDGWQLELHRVRNMDIFDSNLSTPVYISHGHGCASVDFMLNPRNESLIFILADRGYDVWAMNYRSNKFSSKVMINGTPSEPRPEDYYRATWQYMAEHDVPAALDKIREVTKQMKLFMVGHSMGATILFSFLSQIKFCDYHKEILKSAFLAPVIRFGEDTCEALKKSLADSPLIPRLARGKLFRKIFGQQVVDFETPGHEALKKFTKSQACKEIPEVCSLVMNILLAEPDEVDKKAKRKPSPHMNPARAAIYDILYPASITVMNLYLYGVQYRRPIWQKMDYDDVKLSNITNMQEYNQTRPPHFNFINTFVPYKVYFAKKDKYYGVKTAMQLVEDLGLQLMQNMWNGRTYKLIHSVTLEHQDVVWGWDARCHVYDDLIAEWDSIEFTRSVERWDYRGRVLDYQETLPFAKPCSMPLPD